MRSERNPWVLGRMMQHIFLWKNPVITTSLGSDGSWLGLSSRAADLRQLELWLAASSGDGGGEDGYMTICDQSVVRVSTNKMCNAFDIHCRYGFYAQILGMMMMFKWLVGYFVARIWMAMVAILLVDLH